MMIQEWSIRGIERDWHFIGERENNVNGYHQKGKWNIIASVWIE